jgi:hypothetical protein
MVCHADDTRMYLNANLQKCHYSPLGLDTCTAPNAVRCKCTPLCGYSTNGSSVRVICYRFNVRYLTRCGVKYLPNFPASSLLCVDHRIICEIICSTSSFTPSRVTDLRLFNQFMPTKYKPEYCVIPRCCKGKPSSSVSGSLTSL